MGKERVIIPVKALKHIDLNDKPVIRISAKAYNYLVDITNESAGLSLASVVSSIVEQVVEKQLIDYKGEEEG